MSEETLNLYWDYEGQDPQWPPVLSDKEHEFADDVFIDLILPRYHSHSLAIATRGFGDPLYFRKRVFEAYRMRRDGATYQKIGDALNVSKQRSRDMVLKATRAINYWRRRKKRLYEIAYTGYVSVCSLQEVLK